MARKKKTKARKKTTRKTTRKASARRGGRKRGAADLIISKSRTKGASALNVSGEFYGALDGAVRDMISKAEQRASDNGRRTLRPHDL